MRFALILPVAFALLLGILLYAGLDNDPRHIPSPLVGKEVPDFSLPLLHEPDRMLSKADLAGTPYLLNIFGSWCPACREEHPEITRIAEMDILPVYALDWKDEREDALRWLRQFGNPYKAVLFDYDGKTGIDFGVYGAPETFLVSANGVILHKHIGPLDVTTFQNDFLPLIGKEPSQ